MSDSGRAQVVTFYSYKGGTGRSQALANVAWILASNRRRVLVIDWDLKAPGLHRYFAPFLFDASLAETDGLIEFVLEYSTKALTRASSRGPEGGVVQVARRHLALRRLGRLPVRRRGSHTPRSRWPSGCLLRRARAIV